ncbi:sister chromatid cohesion 1 protein 4 [Morus notabilis]|uniref:sister chromatid cohesion 1 protein 4 n=1 Tax=Morus notabilis TaxID=981085 RepID=UPI000CED5B03|nr:sister chromatid cohesion 1 protein 4 [Morus notabilis]
MFYSQFILAKKGPLGTIWIAAHLERKLRKNQVADTDIGVSVDSILFPDVPIALRLSSHLLLGVVRIYSRKVNYLFDDCSEALLKIKQAFRSTAVDLPPEESTAPYHSITLPETFDLDDFELPDNEMLQGNYVDHHVSAREQITLQDTMDGVVYSTSQFGLDERFGDGDTSQIRLDLDEDLFLGKVAAKENNGIPDTEPLASAQPMTPVEKDEAYEGISGTTARMQTNNDGDQNKIQAANGEAIVLAQTPLTPGFMECPSPSNVQGALSCDGQTESKDHDLLEPEALECTVTLSKSDALETVSRSEENGYLSGDMEMKQAKTQVHSASIAVIKENISADNDLSAPSSVMLEHVNPIPLEPECSNGNVSALDGPTRVEDIHNGVVLNNKLTAHHVERTDVQCAESPTCSQVTTEMDDPGRRTCSADVEIHNNTGESCSPSNALASNVVYPPESPGRPEVVNVEAQTLQEQKETNGLNHSNEHMGSNDLPGLRACSTRSQLDASSLRGEGTHSTDILEPNAEKRQLVEPAGSGETPNDCRKFDEEMDNAASCDNQLENVEKSAASDLPAPEKMLSASEGQTCKPNELLLETTPEKEVSGDDGGGAASKAMSGKKRSFTESTLTVHSLNSSESFGMNKSRRTAEYIPGDDDLLSSILVGRKSSVLKMKPTPPAPEIISTKRLRSASRASASKRKVLMDDIMVLHGDTIRQQLTNTEDIRRVRKKAPCTRPEISMIQRQFLEEEMFSEPIFTGMSAALIFLHCGVFDLSRIKVSENDQDNAPIELAKDVESSVAARNDVETQPDNIPCLGEDQHTENNDLRSQHETFGEVAEMEIDGQNVEVADAADHILHGIESQFPTDPVSNDANVPENIVQTDLVDTKNDANASLQMDASSMSPQKLDTEPVLGASLVDKSSEGVDTIVAGHDVEIRVDTEKDNGNLHPSETVGCDNMASENGDQSVGGTGNDNLSVMNPDEVQASELGCDEKDLTSRCVQGEGVNLDSSFLVEPILDGENAFLNKGETSDFQEADMPSITNAEIAAECSTIEVRGDFEDVTIANDTEFLNVDDDEVAEDDEDNEPGTEDTRLLENTGWSSRTRAVAKYLQTLFDKEELHGRRVLPMDNLLTGKTRKEASRMFFETLVLKTKDYIHVEQAKPFDNIILKPQIKLMKSDF